MLHHTFFNNLLLTRTTYVDNITKYVIFFLLGDYMYLENISSILGGPHLLGQTIRSTNDLIEIGRKGVQKKCFLLLAKYMNTSPNQLAKLLPITERTLQRRNPTDALNRETSECILQVAAVIAKGAEVFDDKDRFLAWLNQPNTTFAGQIPVSLLDSRFGADIVLNELGRIEHGVFS